MKTNVYLESVQGIPPEIQKETMMCFGISDKLSRILEEKGLTQKDFAKRMGKSESEISVWLSGQHNFTIRTLAKISTVLQNDLIHI